MNNKAIDLIGLNGCLYRCAQTYFDRELKKFNLSMATYPYVLSLSKNEGINQNEISRKLYVDKSMSAKSIKKLISLGYVHKKEDKEDARAYKLYLTDKAKDIIPQILEVRDRWIDILSQGSDDEKIETSIDFLWKALENGKDELSN
ncbi:MULTISPECIES: MarR family winged helix-turn-helix transcriptional regulator [Clostridium]|uniref:MarR family winged helix-turn-helix transcriptional regulator n=1 Tax=Clostridium TaxID=1485 RepID=UPI0008263E0B|nr:MULTISPECIES: MarR family transcriptional regulator [Clostridium]PJI08465.1 MarR family transcriptional regulator [Clostridium sp. CT7]